ncbi:MAG: hypothetical protein O6945_14530 [Gammaproteobacteria bacterium]|nr:hypothetical protein [Gammaproteobacteria bacterium]
MTGRKLLWVLPFLLYFIFTFWYTNTEGPLSEDEIDVFVAQVQLNGLSDEQASRLREFMVADTGRQFLMLNNLDMADNPATMKGAALGESAGESASDLMNRYMEHMYPELFKRACHPIYLGEAVFTALDIVGIEGGESWDRAALFRYRSRRDFMEIVSNPALPGKHEFKIAALDKTIAYPLENTIYLSDPRMLLALILISVVALIDIALYSRRS